MVHVLDGTPGNLEATPVVVNGVMYVAVPVGGGVIALERGDRRGEVEA